MGLLLIVVGRQDLVGGVGSVTPPPTTIIYEVTIGKNYILDPVGEFEILDQVGNFCIKHFVMDKIYIFK